MMPEILESKNWKTKVFCDKNASNEPIVINGLNHKNLPVGGSKTVSANLRNFWKKLKRVGKHSLMAQMKATGYENF